MWFADIVVDLAWFQATDGKLPQPRSRRDLAIDDPNLTAGLLLYGDEQAIRHVRVVFHTSDRAAAEACVNRNIQAWANLLEVASVLATPTFSTVAIPQRNSTSFLVILGEGDETAETAIIRSDLPALPKADFEGSALLMTAWRPDFNVHLHFLARFLNHTLPPEVRWLNGYRVLEWHFRRGKVGLAKNKAYLALLAQHGEQLDADTAPDQTRQGLIEEVRALAAHAVLARTSDIARGSAGTDLLLKTFAALEILVMVVMNEGTNGDVRSFADTARLAMLNNPPS